MRVAIYLDKSDLNKLETILLNRIVDAIFTKSQENLVEDIWDIGNKKTHISDTGFLLKSGNIERGNKVVKIVYSVPYAEYVEFGRPAGSMPPIIAIEKWIRRKLGIKKNSQQIAFAIAKKIENRGIDPRPFLRNAIEEVLNGKVSLKK